MKTAILIAGIIVAYAINPKWPSLLLTTGDAEAAFAVMIAMFVIADLTEWARKIE